MRVGERPFSVTGYARLSEVNAAKRMLARGYCQVSRRFGHVARVNVSDTKLLAKLKEVCGICTPKPANEWYDYYRRCISEDVITDVPEPVMFMIRNPGEVFVFRPPWPSDEEFIAAIIEFGLHKEG